jgi:hypothetical protein
VVLSPLLTPRARSDAHWTACIQLSSRRSRSSSNSRTADTRTTATTAAGARAPTGQCWRMCGWQCIRKLAS